MYKLNEHIFFRVQAKSLTDLRPQKVVGPNQELSYSTFENSRAFYVGVGVVL